MIARTVPRGSFEEIKSSNVAPQTKREGLAKRVWKFLLTDVEDFFREKEYNYNCSVDSNGDFLLQRYNKKTGMKDQNYLTKLVTVPQELL